MRAAQARVAVFGVVGLLVAAIAAVPVTAARQHAQLGPAQHIERVVPDPAAGAAELAAWSQAEHDAAVARYLQAVAAERARQAAADAKRAADARAAAQRAARSATAPRGGTPAGAGVWAALAECESSSRWHLDARYDGGLQFDPPTWLSVRADDDPPYAWQASPERQIAAAQRLQARSGWGQWPRCARRLGLR